ncbi:hypothetical protein [Labedaea rhizosphaerae]|uniref:Uncharacterized protein n=1 Tax=Labedaea rhizosphaerae TaxID=598644 RepID=A0A4R6S0F1_LABRH|nr:hypothetical protein [Labedaea rhizosphaerae]TDP92920.1 hypothetical protein EV186_107155 [Labedaea rhizosphaerae]
MIAVPSRRRFTGWLPKRRKKPDDVYARATSGELDIMQLPPYASVEDARRRGIEDVEEQLKGLRPDGLDAGSRDVLSDLVDAWLAAEIALLEPIHDERQAVATVLVGLAEQDLARQKPRYEADLARVLHAREALDAAAEALTGTRTEHLRTRWPARTDGGGTVSSLGGTSYSEEADTDEQAA